MTMKTFTDLDAYIDAAMAEARYEPIESGKAVYAEIPGFEGAWASAPTQQQATSELRKVLQGWIDIQVERNQPLPDIKGLRPPQVLFA